MSTYTIPEVLAAIAARAREVLEQDELAKAVKAPKASATPKAPKAPKTPPAWESDDGVTIPHASDPERAIWDKAFHNSLKSHFNVGNEPVKVPVANLVNRNPVRNYSRFELYKEMARGGDKLPPIVVTEMGDGKFDVIDGNHRFEAAKATGLKHLIAFHRDSAPAPAAKPKKQKEKP